MNINNHTYILTGAAGGIGQAIASALSERGVRLILVGRDEVRLKKVAKNLTNPASHRCVAADITLLDGRKNVFDAAREMGCHGLINNAGLNQFGWFSDAAKSDIANQISTNLLAPMLLVHDLLPLLQAQKESVIVNIGSSFGSIGYPGYSAYCASKFGLRGFSEALRRELVDTSVSVLYVAPRATNTTLNTANVVAMNKALGSHSDAPELVAAKVVSAIEKNRRNTFIGWPEKLFIKINGLFPKIIDRNLQKNVATIRSYAKQSPQV